MPIELTAHTDAGARLVAIAERLAEELAARAAEHDRDGTYPFEAIDALKAAGYFAAPVPVELGGLGVASAHDLVVASSRLARGDASVAIGVNMHLVAVLNMERRRQVAVAAGAERRARGFAAVARADRPRRRRARRRHQRARPGPHAAGHARDPHRRRAGGSTAARCSAPCRPPPPTSTWPSRYADGEGVERYAYAMVPTDAPGVVVHDDWDALGHARLRQQLDLARRRRAARVRRPRRLPRRRPGAVHGAQPRRRAVPRRRPRSASPSRPTRSPAAGIAGRINGDARPRMQVADNAVDLAAARGVLSRAAALIDEHRAANPASDGSAERARRAVRRGAGGQGVRQRGRRPHRRPRARALRRRRLPQRQPARARLPRRQGRLVHAPARRQPRLRLPRPRRARRDGGAALRWRSRPQRRRAGAGRARVPRRARPVRDRRRLRHRGAGRRAGRADRELARVRLARSAARLVLPVAQLAHVVAHAAGAALRRQRAGPPARALRAHARPPPAPTASPASTGRRAAAASRCSPTPSPSSSARSSPSTPPAITGSSSAGSTTLRVAPADDPLVFFAGAFRTVRCP